MENTSKPPVFDRLDIRKADQLTIRRARRYGDLVYADQFLFVYAWRGDLYYMEPPDQLRNEVTEHLMARDIGEALTKAAETIDLMHEEPQGIRFNLDDAPEVHSTGRRVDEPLEKAPVNLHFDPAVVMQLTHELAWSLRELYSRAKERMYFAEKFDGSEYNQIQEAGDLLTRYAEEYGVDWAEADEQDQLLRRG